MERSGIKQLYFGPFRYKDAYDQYRWLETVVTNLYDDPAVKGIVTNSRDITERKKLKRKTKRFKRKAY
jgi:PAS domain S-box-containing protein